MYPRQSCEGRFMRRYAVISVVLLVIAVFLSAWVQAQEGTRRQQSPTPRQNAYATEFAPARESTAPRQLEMTDEAAPINNDGGLELSPPLPTDSLVLPTAGPTGEPEMAAPQVAQRRLRGSRLGPTVMPATPVAESPNLDGELADNASSGTAAAGPGIPSVLKKRAGTPPTAALQAREPRLTPTVVDAGDAPTSIGTSSRRAMPSSKPLLIRSVEGDMPRATASAVPPGSPAASPAAATPAATITETLQLQGTSPNLAVAATGPQAVTVGKPATYQVQLTNDSAVAAQEVQVRIGLPQSVELQDGSGSRGEAKQEADPSGRQWLIWSLPDVPAGGKEQLTLQLVARQNQPFQLAVSWSAKPMELGGEVSVREPQVAVRLEGPSDMLFGEQKTFTLHVSNPGTGDAEQVAVEVSSGGAPNRLEVGTLAAGQQKQIPFSVTASAPGEMEIRAQATGAGGLSGEAASRVNIHKAELQVAVHVPPLSFAGSESILEVAVANVGDAIAEQVVLGVTLPPGAKYLGGLDGATTTENGLLLKMGNLPPNSEKLLEMRCTLTESGEARFEATAQGKGDLLSSQVAATRVEALADLKLTVVEPRGPLPVGGEAMYEVRVANRGTKSAEKVKIAVQFAQGLEPVEVEGGTATVSNGQALFEPLHEVAAGQEVVLRVKAKTEKAGNHAFRVEVKTGEPETKLVSEGVSRCYAEAGGMRATARRPSALQPTPAAPATKIR
jgi:uncharacterized repeat protein (TIGR01451 family)